MWFLLDTEEGCKQCQKVLAELENIDDEADSNGIDFVKLDDNQVTPWHYSNHISFGELIFLQLVVFYVNIYRDNSFY